MPDVAINLESEVKKIIDQLTPQERKYFKFKVASLHNFSNPDYVFAMFNDAHRSAERICETSLDVIEEVMGKEESRRLEIVQAVERLRA